MGSNFLYPLTLALIIMKYSNLFITAAFVVDVIMASATPNNDTFVTRFGYNTVPNPDRCEPGTLQQSNCATNNTGPTCTVQLTSTGAIVEAYDTQASATSCANQLFQHE